MSLARGWLKFRSYIGALGHLKGNNNLHLFLEFFQYNYLYKNIVLDIFTVKCGLNFQRNMFILGIISEKCLFCSVYLWDKSIKYGFFKNAWRRYNMIYLTFLIIKKKKKWENHINKIYILVRKLYTDYRCTGIKFYYFHDIITMKTVRLW